MMLTDVQYIEGMFANNQAVYADFYERNMSVCKSSVVTRFLAVVPNTSTQWLFNKYEEYDVYNSSMMRLYMQIKERKIFVEKGSIFIDSTRQGKNALNCSLSNYLCSIAKNVFSEHYKVECKRSEVEIYEESLSDILNAEEEEIIEYVFDDDSMYGMDKEELLAGVRKIVKEMPDICKRIFTLTYWKGLKGKEIAQKMGYTNEGSVRNQKGRCLEKFKSKFNEFVL